MDAIPKTFLTLSLFLIPFLSSAQLSASKLSAHLIGDYTAGSSNIVANSNTVSISDCTIENAYRFHHVLLLD